MKKLILLLLAVAGFTIASIASAQTYGSMSDRPSFGPKFGMGMSAAQNLTGTANAAASFLWFGYNENHIFQGYAGIDTHDPFAFGVAGTYKYTVLGTLTTGAHFGGGLGLGKFALTDKFRWAISGVGGIHFRIPSLSRIFFSFDGGLTFSKSDDFERLELGSLGSLLGLSAHYLF